MARVLEIVFFALLGAMTSALLLSALWIFKCFVLPKDGDA